MSQIEVSKNIVMRAGKKLSEYFEEQNKVILSQVGRDIKALADSEIEKFIRAELASNFPNEKILGEELGTANFDDLSGFVIDPIDGTMNFAKGNPIFCISLAYLDRGEPVWGILYNPVLKEMIVGIENQVYLNDKKVSVKAPASSDQAVLATGIPTKLNIDDTESFVNYLSVIKKFKKVRMIGSAAQSVGWIGLGRIDAYKEDSTMLWDVAAGLAIVKAAGGVYSMQRVDEKSWKYNIRAALSSNLLAALD